MNKLFDFDLTDFEKNVVDVNDYEKYTIIPMIRYDTYIHTYINKYAFTYMLIDLYTHVDRFIHTYIEYTTLALVRFVEALLLYFTLTTPTH